MKNRTDLNLGEVVYITIIYHIPILELLLLLLLFFLCFYNNNLLLLTIDFF